jgi:hypothetical protein
MIRHSFSLFALGTLVTSQVLPLRAATAPGSPDSSLPAYCQNFPAQANARFVGAAGCQSSLCHGGADPMHNQNTVWSQSDFHSRAYATLVTARSTRIAEGLGIASATESFRCTTCHAPLAAVPAEHLATTANVSEGVSCESCHNGASSWLRSHTRYDYTYANRVQSGMRDLRSAYVRAETCVSCHQVIDPALLKAGHPELVFELDGQTASEPRHWVEKEGWSGAKAWLVGQAVALREISGQLQTSPNSDLLSQRKALEWVVEKGPVEPPFSFAGQTGTAKLTSTRDQQEIAGGKNTARASEIWSNEVAQTVSKCDWRPAMTIDMLTKLIGTSSSFTDNSVPLAERELRAERLVLGLDRLFKSLHPDAATAPGHAELAALFDAVQDRNQFDPTAFAKQLQKFADAIK